MTLLHLLLMIKLLAQPTPTPADIAWVAKGRFCEPETVLPLPDDTLLVSNVCNFAEKGTGFLSLLDGKGMILDWRIVDHLDAPLGMALVDGALYLVDANRVRVFRWPGFSPVEIIKLDTVISNDIAVAADGTIYVTDTAANKVIKRAVDGTQSLLTGKTQFKGANGIALQDNLLYVGGARLWRVNLDSGQVTTVGPEWLADIDGIEFEADGTLQITPVGGPLIRYRNEAEIDILAGKGVSSANHGYSHSLGLALIPTGFDNTVVAIKIVLD